MSNSLFHKALLVGRPPNIQKLFPNSKALIISGKFIKNNMFKNKKTTYIAVNARNIFIIIGALKAAQRSNSGLIIEIAKSEGGRFSYCSINFWNLARIVDSLCNEFKITVPIVIHADHYTIKTKKDLVNGIVEIPTLFESGITSLAIDASYLPDKLNLLSSIELNKVVPKWSGLETEIGEIKGKFGLSTKDEALFIIKGLNAHNIFPDWIALNNGTVHGLNSTNQQINIELTSEIHNSLVKYGVTGAQHGTSGNRISILKKINLKTNTTKANIATALQMISWGIKVNEEGNASLDNNGNFIKLKNHGVTKEIWNKMVDYSHRNNWKGNEYKKLNLVFDNILLSQPKKIRQRIIRDVENFLYNLITNVFHSENTKEIIIEDIVKKNNYFPGIENIRIENPEEWTYKKILQKASLLNKNVGPIGNYDD